MNMWVYMGFVGLVVAYMTYMRVANKKPDPAIADRLDPQKHWVQAAIALYQGDVGDAGYWSSNEAREKLSSGWSTTTRDELLELLQRYIDGECNVGFDKLRIIWLARLGRGAGWIDDAASWGYALPAVAELKRTYGSWPELYEAMKEGRAEWYGGADKVPAGTLKLNERGFAYASKQFFPSVPYR
jgi:hypothetical protein